MSINWSKLQSHLHGAAMSGLQVNAWEAWTQWKQHKQHGQIDVVWAPRGWHVVPMYRESETANDDTWEVRNYWYCPQCHREVQWEGPGCETRDMGLRMTHLVCGSIVGLYRRT